MNRSWRQRIMAQHGEEATRHLARVGAEDRDDHTIRADLQRAELETARRYDPTIGEDVQTIGSRTGRLVSLSDDGELRATLRCQIDGEPVPLRCREEHREQLRAAWGRDRVEVNGRITETAQGQALWIDVHDIELLPLEPTLSTEELRGGFWPDMTGGLSAREHLAAIRGEKDDA